MPKEVEKVVAYISREKFGRREILVFEHRDFQEAGIQVPAGTVEFNEPIEQAVLREIREESGLIFHGSCKHLGRFQWPREDRNELHQRNVFHLQFSSELEDEWTHAVQGHDEDKDLVFRYFWLGIKEAREQLAANQGMYLNLLER